MKRLETIWSKLKPGDIVLKQDEDLLRSGL